MADLFGLSLDAAAGGIFGIVGTALGRVAGYFERKQAFKHEVQRYADTVIMPITNLTMLKGSINPISISA